MLVGTGPSMRDSRLPLGRFSLTTHVGSLMSSTRNILMAGCILITRVVGEVKHFYYGFVRLALR